MSQKPPPINDTSQIASKVPSRKLLRRIGLGRQAGYCSPTTEDKLRRSEPIGSLELLSFCHVLGERGDMRNILHEGNEGAFGVLFGLRASALHLNIFSAIGF